MTEQKNGQDSILGWAMPLSFNSKSHGSIAFGFFNIETDLLLLENYFFFADDFCGLMAQLESAANDFTVNFKVRTIENTADVGDLMGAIHGVHFSGFIGEVYKRYPFPEQPQAFKQNPQGVLTRDIINDELDKWAHETDLEVRLDRDGQFAFGRFVFLKQDFWELIRYVWQGGYPRWKDEIRPDYVLRMKQVLQDSRNACFSGVF